MKNATLSAAPKAMPAKRLSSESLAFEESYAAVIGYFPKKPCKILDIGSGTGRDAAWFDERGHEVVAAEPTKELREGAISLHPSPTIRWLDDSLPSLDGWMTACLVWKKSEV